MCATTAALMLGFEVKAIAHSAVIDVLNQQLNVGTAQRQLSNLEQLHSVRNKIDKVRH
jgi:hypothetical protein